MYPCEWFETDDDQLSPNAMAFATSLRGRAARWPMSPCNSCLFPAEDGRPVIGYLDRGTPGSNLGLITVGVHFFEDWIIADKVHDQGFHLPAEPTPLRMEACGPPAELGDRVADWFEEIITRPVVRGEWHHRGQVYFEAYEFVDGYPLVSIFRDELAPAGQAGRRGEPDHIEILAPYQL